MNHDCELNGGKRCLTSVLNKMSGSRCYCFLSFSLFKHSDAATVLQVVPLQLLTLTVKKTKYWATVHGAAMTGCSVFFILHEEPFNLSPVRNFIGSAYRASVGRHAFGSSRRFWVGLWRPRGLQDRRRRYFIGFVTPQWRLSSRRRRDAETPPAPATTAAAATGRTHSGLAALRDATVPSVPTFHLL